MGRNGFDLEKGERQLREHCKQEGIDLDRLLDGASKHFQGPFPKPRTLTEQEIELLVKNQADDPLGEALEAIDKEVRVVNKPTWEE